MRNRRSVSSLRNISCGFVLAIILAANAGCPRPDRQPPGNVTDFTATGGDGQVNLSWVNPTDDDFAGVKIKRKEGGYPSGPNDGTTVYTGSATQALDATVTNGTLYYYAAFSYDPKFNYSSGAQAEATPAAVSTNTRILEEFDDVGTAVAAAPIPDEAREALSDKLIQADTAYRGGDPCEAATLLGEYEETAQDYRGKSTLKDEAGELEELYTLGRRLRYDMILAEQNTTPCPGQERIGVEASVAVDNQHNSNTELWSTVAFGEPRLLSVRENGEVFTQVFVPGSDNLSGEPGAPAVPTVRRIVAVPDGAQVSCEVTATNAETINVNLLPTQFPAVDADPGPEPDPSVFANPPFTQNTERYQSDTPYPAELCTTTDLGRLRDLRVFQLEIPAGQYNAFSESLILFSEVEVKLSFTGGTGKFLPANALSSFESDAALYMGSVLNRNIVGQYLDAATIFDALGEEFMILTPTALRTAADTLADWKNQKGIVTQVFEVGAGTSFTTAESIVNLIRDEYEDSHIRPSYVLLLGDTSQIPTNYIAPNGDVGAPTIATDYPYAAFQLLGILPRVAVGRIPVSTLVDANTVVNRIVAYESDPPANPAFYRNVTIASQFQCCRTDAGIDDGTDQRTFIETSEFVRSALFRAGYTVERIYTRTTDDAYTSDDTPRRYFDGTLLPSAIAPGSGFGWNGSGTDITNAWNTGRFLMIHRDHGWPGGWGNPDWDWADASALTNGDLLPVVFSVNCASGLFDQATAGGAMGTMAGVQYFAERLLTNANGGAIGMLGDTRNSPTWANSALLRGFVDAVWPNTIPDFGGNTVHRRLGDILNHGKIYLLTQNGISGNNITYNDTGDEFKMWHCIGDPTLEMWTANPNRSLVTSIDVSLVGSNLLANYEVEGTQFTAYQYDDQDLLQVVGRGTVVNGVANFEMVGFAEPDDPVTLAATLPDSVPVLIQTDIHESPPPGP